MKPFFTGPPRRKRTLDDHLAPGWWIVLALLVCAAFWFAVYLLFFAG